QAQGVTGRQHAAEILNIRQRRGLTGKLRPHEEAPGFVVNKFAVGHDVQAATKNHAGDLVDDTGFVRAINRENVVLHAEANPLTTSRSRRRDRSARLKAIGKSCPSASATSPRPRFRSSEAALLPSPPPVCHGQFSPFGSWLLL